MNRQQNTNQDQRPLQDGRVMEIVAADSDFVFEFITLLVVNKFNIHHFVGN